MSKVRKGLNAERRIDRPSIKLNPMSSLDFHHLDRMLRLHF
jgi:hypothetical protein